MNSLTVIIIFFVVVFGFAYLMQLIGVYFQKQDWKQNRKKGETYDNFCKRSYTRWN